MRKFLGHSILVFWLFLSTAECATGNTEVTLPRASAPLCSLEGGFYSTPQWIVLSTGEPGGEIRFTLDGSIPGSGSHQYLGPTRVETTSLLRARVFAPGKDPSAVLTRSILFADPGSIASLSLVTAPENLWDASTGIYVNPLQQGEEWERPASIEFFPNSEEGFRIDAGVRIHGGIGRNFEKKSFRFYFSDAYGPSRLQYPLFPNNDVQSYKRLVLSGAANDSYSDPREIHNAVWTLLRDRVMAEIFQRSGMLTPRERPVRLFLNGQPWGIYWLKERVDEQFIEDHTGLRDFDLLKHEHVVSAVKGDTADWNAMTRFFETFDPINSASYERICRWIDLDNFIEHYLIEMWGNNLDWPHNNTYQYRPRVPTGLWRWVPWDIDTTLGNPDAASYDWNMYPHVTGEHEFEQDWSAIHFQKLHSHPDFRNRFLNRIADLMNTTLKVSETSQIIAAAAGEIRGDISFETSRWGSSSIDWEAHVSGLQLFARQRNTYFLDYTSSFFGLSGQYRLTLRPPVGKGSVRLNRLELDRFPWSGAYFKGVPVPLVALPAPGYQFERWDGGGLANHDSVSLVSQVDVQIRPVFVPSSSVAGPNDVLINEYWNNDDGTIYESLGERPLWGDWIELLVAAEEGVDLRNWRLTNNLQKGNLDPLDPLRGSVLFRPIPELANLPQGTVILIVVEETGSNADHFQVDDLDSSDGEMVLNIPNGNLDSETDPGFQIRNQNDAIVLLAPGPSASFEDDVGVDFVAEGNLVTPKTFGVAEDGIVFQNPFEGIGDDDGAVFGNDPSGGTNNDNGMDPLKDDLPGPGGWTVDPPAEFTEIGMGTILSPGERNPCQSVGASPTCTQTPSPTVTPTPTETQLHPFDWDGSGRVDDADLLQLIREFRDPGPDPRADFDGNGTVDSSDVLMFMTQYKARAAGSSR